VTSPSPIPVSADSQRVLRDVLVIGGGLAGLSSACALAQAGFRVQLLERRPYVGGRASSYEHPGVTETIDNCQHVLLGCCTNLVDFYKRIGVDRKIDWTDRITFVEPGGRRSTLKPGLLPAPMHSTPSFLAASMLSLADKSAISHALRQFVPGALPEEQRTFGDWLRANRQTPNAVEHFWRPIIESALNDHPDNVSVHYASQVFHETLLKSPQAGFMGLSTVPLGELYGRAFTFLEDRRGSVHLRASVERVDYDPATARWRAQTLDGHYDADAVVFALPYQAMHKLLPEVQPVTDAVGVRNLSLRLDNFRSAPITSVHLWLDRVITDLPHAALLDSPVHWMFQKSRIQPAARAAASGSYLELVISHSIDMVAMSRQKVLDIALEELPRFFPAMSGAKVLKSAVVKEVNATFRVPPGIDKLRPSPIAPWPRAFLAGDWTATGWPSTMESAVRSGHLAAEQVCSLAGKSERFLAPDMQPAGLMRFFVKP
jgi:zeta-carotene desaturase